MLFRSKAGQPFSGYLDASNVAEGGDLRLTIQFGDEVVDLDIKGNEVIFSQVCS